MTSRDKTRVWAYTGLPWKIDFNLSTHVSRINSLTIFRVQTLVVPPYILGFLYIMDQNVNNFLLYTHILISQKINFVTEVRFSQKRSHINPYGYSLQTKFHVHRSHTFWEKCDDNLKLASQFSPILCDQGTWNFFCILTHMDTLCKPNFMFLGHTLFEKNAMITCKNSKLYNCPNKQLWNFTN